MSAFLVLVIPARESPAWSRFPIARWVPPSSRLALAWIELWLVPSISKSVLRLSEYFREAPIGQPHEILFKIVLFRAYHKCKSSLFNQETTGLHLPFKTSKYVVAHGQM